MGRKGAKQQRQLARDEFNYERAWKDDQRKERKESKNLLMPEFQKLYQESFGYQPKDFQGFGYTPEGFTTKLFSDKERDRIIGSGVRSARIPYEDAASDAKRRMTRTRNTAGYGAILGELTRGKSRSMADITRKATADITEREAGTRFGRKAWLEDQRFGRGTWLENERYRRRTGGLAGLMELFGIDTSLLQGTAGLTNAALGQHAAGIEPGKWETVMSPLIAGASSAAGSYFGSRR